MSTFQNVPESNPLHPGTNHPQILSVLLQNCPDWSTCFLPSVYKLSRHISQNEIANPKLDHVTPLFKTIQWLIRVKAKVIIISLKIWYDLTPVTSQILSPTTLFLSHSTLNTLAPSQCPNPVDTLPILGLFSSCFLYLEGSSPKRLLWLFLSPSSDLY